MLLPEDIITKIRHDFSEDDSLRVLQILSESQKHDPQIFQDRVLRSIVVVVKGRIEHLSEAIRLARVDWRDLISAAEYPSGNRVRILSMPFGSHPDVEVLKDWLTGQRLTIPWCLNDKWTIEFAEIRELSIEEVNQLTSVSKSASDSSVYLAYLTFLCIRGRTKEISVSKAIEGKAVIHYNVDGKTNGFTFLKFNYRSSDIRKRGRW